MVLALLRHRRPASELRVVHVNGGQTAVEAIRAASTDISRGGDYIIKWRAMVWKKQRGLVWWEGF